MAYHFIIHTKGFVPFQWSEENTDGLRRNAVITAMDGLKFRESSEKALRWRIGMFLHGAYAECDEADYEAYYAWMNRPRNIFRYYDPLYMHWEKLRVEAPGFHQGYCSIDKIIESVKKDGSYHLPFKAAYDARQYSKNLDACYCEIKKV